MSELAERAVKAKGWRWMEGMAILIGVSCVERCVAVGARGPAYRDGYGRLTVVQFALPALDDPATVGCLLALVREAWGDSGVSVWHVRSAGVWSWMAGGCIHGVWRPSDADGYETEAAALVAALEAAP